MGMLDRISRRAKAHAKIAGLDLNPAVAMAKKYFGLIDDEVEVAMQDYRHFLYLVYWNWREENNLPVIPTKHGDKVWHGHLLFNMEYNQFCEKLIGKVLYHTPGLEEGTIPFLNGVANTKALHDRRAAGDGFNPHYFSHVKVERIKEKVPRETSSSDGGDGGVTIFIISGNNDNGDSGGGDSGGGGCGGD